MPDSPSAWLRSLAAEATPGPWIVQKSPPWIEGHITYDDARLIALAPDLAVLCADMEHFIRFSVNRGTRVGNISARDLLARFAALQPDNQEEPS